MSEQQLPLVSILILNYNGKKFLDDCFNSVLKSSYPNFETIMIDNLSDDDSVAYTEQNYPQVQVFQNGVNGGYSLAYNNGFKTAKGKYVVALNNDVTVKPDWIERKHTAGSEPWSWCITIGICGYISVAAVIR